LVVATQHKVPFPTLFEGLFGTILNMSVHRELVFPTFEMPQVFSHYGIIKVPLLFLMISSFKTLFQRPVQKEIYQKV